MLDDIDYLFSWWSSESYSKSYNLCDPIEINIRIQMFKSKLLDENNQQICLTIFRSNPKWWRVGTVIKLLTFWPLISVEIRPHVNDQIWTVGHYLHAWDFFPNIGLVSVFPAVGSVSFFDQQKKETFLSFFFLSLNTILESHFSLEISYC